MYMILIRQYIFEIKNKSYVDLQVASVDGFTNPETLDLISVPVGKFS